jgi:hypothetical protein
MATSTLAGPGRLELTDDPKVLSILRIHHALWNREDFIERDDKQYKPFVPQHTGYTSVVLPNEQGYNLLWITQNMNKSSYGSESIRRSRSQGHDQRITWIVDNNNSKFQYVGSVNTTRYFDGSEDIIIERYTETGTEVLWTNMPFHITAKSKY